MQKSVVIGGSSTKMTITSIHVTQKVSVVVASTRLNAPNGAYKMKYMGSGEDLHPETGKGLELLAT